jgi:alpha-D-xyloside xylohydrolase
MQFRTEILPYLYTAFAQYRFEGTPVIRAMCLVDGGEETDQYLLGDDLLIAPMFAGATTRKVRLPKGTWYDYETGEPVGGGQVMEIRPALDKIPLYVREGALIPTLAPRLRAGAALKDADLIVRHYGNAPGYGRLYEDDGETFEYEHGKCAWYSLTSGGVSGEMKRISGNWTAGYGRIVWKHIGN